MTRVDRKGRHRSEFQPDDRSQGRLDRPEPPRPNPPASGRADDPSKTGSDPMNDPIEKSTLELEALRLVRQKAVYQSRTEELEAAHQEWTSALDVMRTPIFLHDQDFRILRCNRAYRQRAGVPFKQIIQETAVGRVRECGSRSVQQGATTRRAAPCQEEQRRQAAREPSRRSSTQPRMDVEPVAPAAPVDLPPGPDLKIDQRRGQPDD